MSASQVRPLPRGWSRRRLRFDVRTNPVKSELDLSDETEVSFVPMEAVGEYGGLRLEQTRELADVYNGYTYFANGDVCIAKITPCFENGKGAIAEGLTNGVAFGTTELHVLRPSPGLDQKFLFYLTIAHDFRSRGESEMLGAGGQKRVPERFLKDWMPPLPSIEVQQRIARFLDEKTARIDALIEKKQALLERLAEKRQALITHAVTKGLNPNAPMKASGVDWLGEIPRQWVVKPLRRVRRFLTSGSRDWAAFYADEGSPFLRMTNVTGDGIELDLSDLRYVCLDGDQEGTRTLVREGDILITITAELGSVAVVRKQFESGAYINQHLALLRVDDRLCDPVFFVNFLSTDVAREQFVVSGNGGTKQGLGFDQVNGVITAFPRVDEQSQIADYCERVRGMFERAANPIESSIAQLVAYRSAIITAAVTGQLPELNG